MFCFYLLFCKYAIAKWKWALLKIVLENTLILLLVALVYHRNVICEQCIVNIIKLFILHLFMFICTDYTIHWITCTCTYRHTNSIQLYVQNSFKIFNKLHIQFSFHVLFLTTPQNKRLTILIWPHPVTSSDHDWLFKDTFRHYLPTFTTTLLPYSKHEIIRYI